MKIIQQRSRTDETYQREGDLPIYIKWDDGSEYECIYLGRTEHDHEDRRWAHRRFHGPMFNLEIGDWHDETFPVYTKGE